MRGLQSCRTLTCYIFNLKKKKNTTPNLEWNCMRNNKGTQKQKSRSEIKIRNQDCWHQILTVTAGH